MMHFCRVSLLLRVCVAMICGIVGGAPLYMASSSYAASSDASTTTTTRDDVTMPNTVRVGNQSLLLNGMGVRSKSFALFSVNVYVAGLYLEAKNSDAASIINSPGPKQLDMRFVRNVDAEKIRNAWTETYKLNCEPKCAEIKQDFDKLNAAMIDMKKGSLISFVFEGDDLEIREADQPTAKFHGRDFQQFLLKTWIGAHPPNIELREGLLGH